MKMTERFARKRMLSKLNHTYGNKSEIVAWFSELTDNKEVGTKNLKTIFDLIKNVE